MKSCIIFHLLLWGKKSVSLPIYIYCNFAQLLDMGEVLTCAKV